jgi:L-aminopeptidase/D-esterase-like protein
MGSVGAAIGARTATTPGGLGIATETVNDVSVCAITAVNAFGSPLIGTTHHFWAAGFEVGSEFGGYGLPHPWPEDASTVRTKADFQERENTTLACVVTDAALTSGDATRLAVMAHDGFARALYPAHTPADGDLVFALSIGDRPTDASQLIHLGTAAARAVTRAIALGVYHAIAQASH